MSTRGELLGRWLARCAEQSFKSTLPELACHGRGSRLLLVRRCAQLVPKELRGDVRKAEVDAAVAAWRAGAAMARAVGEGLVEQFYVNKGD